jgi:hypothetical protein
VYKTSGFSYFQQQMEAAISFMLPPFDRAFDASPSGFGRCGEEKYRYL